MTEIRLDVAALVDAAGGPRAVAEVTGTHRTAPYGWIRRGFIGSPMLEAIKAAHPDLNIDDFFRPQARGEEKTE